MRIDANLSRMTNADQSWDVIVIGLGAMGAATLYQLARRGVRVLGIDRFHPPHDLGSSHGDTRITRLALGEGAHYLPLARRSHEIWRELEAGTDGTLFRQTGCLVYSSAEGRTPAHGAADFLQTTIDVARDSSIPHEVLNASALQRRFPQFHFAGDETGCYEPSGGLVHPEACINAQLQAARRSGAEIRTGERVLSWCSEGSGVAVETGNCRYRAARLIITAGAWLPQFFPSMAAEARVYRQVLYWFTTETPVDTFSDSVMPVFIRVPDARAAMFYGFPAIDGPDGGLKIAAEQFDHTCDPDEVNREVSPSEAAFMSAMVMPHVRITSDMVRTAVCKYTVTPDFHFVIDHHPDTEKVWFASACSGHGFKHSAAIGEALAQQVTEGRSDCDLGPFSFSRFRA